MSPETSNPDPNESRRSRRKGRSRRFHLGSHKAGSSPEVPNQPKQNIDQDTLEAWAQAYVMENVTFFANDVSDHGLKVLDNNSDETSSADPSESDLVLNITNARERYATASVKARRGTLNFNLDKRLAELDDSEQEYKEARQAFVEHALTDLPKVLTEEQTEAIKQYLESREDGYLMGEEANYYLTKETSKVQRGIEWYTGLSRKKRLAYGLGASALVGVVGGLTAGFAVAGAAVATRFGKGYLNREANRQQKIELTEAEEKAALDSALRRAYADDLKDKTAEEQEAFLKQNDLYEGGYKKRVIERARKNKVLFDKQSNSTLRTRDHQHEYAYRAALDESEREKQEKRKSLKWATAGAIGGAAVGFILENAGGTEWRGIARNGASMDIFGGDGSLDLDNTGTSESDTPSSSPETDSPTTPPEQQPDDATGEADDPNPNQNTPETPEQPQETLAVTERSRYLYGEFAGNEVNLVIPEKSNVWDQLELRVDQQYGEISYGEKQRLVGNMVNAMQNQYPNRNLDIVQPGDTFSFKLSAKA